MDYLPIISLGAAGQGEAVKVAAEIDRALSQVGFFIIRDHGVPNGVIDAAMAEARLFFDSPDSQKLHAASSGQGSPRGYIPVGAENLALTLGQKTLHDLREGYSIGPPRIKASRQSVASLAATYRPNRWPNAPQTFQATFLTYYAEMELLTGRLMRVFAAALHLQPDYFSSRFEDHNSTLWLAHYPPQNAASAPDQLRAGAHTDYGALTILLGENRPGGLEIQMPNGDWLPVNTEPRDFIINIGDLMMTWSNDRWRSTPHRVANPPPAVRDLTSRLSSAYFCNPDDALEIACLPGCATSESPAKYAPMTAAEHRHQKIALSLCENAP
jgi:isopenicillin N synthase-like dioxygenase